MNNKTKADILRLAEHYKAIGHTSHYIYDEEPEWGKVTKVESGGSYRNGIPVSYYFTSEEGGMKFRYNLDIELPGSNGLGGYRLDIAKLKGILALLPAPVAKQFASMLRDGIKEGRVELEQTRKYLKDQEQMIQFMENALEA